MPGDFFNEFLVPDFESLDKELGSAQWFQRQDQLNQVKMMQEQSTGQSGGQGNDPNQATQEQVEEAQYRPTYDRNLSETKQERLERVKEEYGRRPFISVGASTVKSFCKEKHIITAKEMVSKHLLIEEKGKYVLPPLPYEYNALEPHIDQETMQLHHDKHHQKYIDDLNDALKALSKVKKAEDPQVRPLLDKIAFNGSGHVLHSIFWLCLTAKSTKKPEENLEVAKAVKKHFGKFEKFCVQFMEAAKTVQGSGWAILAVEPWTGRLVILQAEKHQNLTMWGVVPILVMDVWELAYYLKYKNDRAAYVEAICNNLINWDMVNGFYQQAMKSK